MLSLAQCRKLLDGGCGLSDEQVLKLRNELDELAQVILDLYPKVCSNEPRGCRKVISLSVIGEREYLIERAAIREFDGGMPRKEAERAAVRDTLRTSD